MLTAFIACLFHILADAGHYLFARAEDAKHAAIVCLSGPIFHSLRCFCFLRLAGLVLRLDGSGP